MQAGFRVDKGSCYTFAILSHHPFCMANTKAKKSGRKAANTPAPCGPGSTCGHSGCEGGTCSARYVWTAAIVAGLAVVLTGTVAYTSAQAQDKVDTPSLFILNSLRRIEQRLDRIEPKLESACLKSCGDAYKVCAEGAGDDTGAQAACEDTARSCQNGCTTPVETAE